MSLAVLRVDLVSQFLPKLLFILLFTGFYLVSRAQACKARYDVPTATYLLSLGGGFPDFYAAQTWYNNSLKPAADQVLIKDYGALLLRVDRSVSDLKTDIGATLYYTRQYFEYNTQKKYAKVDTADYQDLGLGLRLNRYFVRKEQFHFYVGAGVGVRIPLHDTFFTPFYGELVAGIRYFPMQRMGIFLEIGPSKVLGQAGITIKL